MTSPSNIVFRVKHQTDGRRAYAEHGGALCSRCRLNPPNDGQRYCKGCTTIVRREGRSRARNEKISRLHALIRELEAASQSASELIYRDAPRRCIATIIRGAKAKIARLQEAERGHAQPQPSTQSHQGDITHDHA